MLCVCLLVCAGECRCLRDQKRALDPLELMWQALVSILAWVLGSKLRSSARTNVLFLTTEPSPQPLSYTFLIELLDQQREVSTPMVITLLMGSKENNIINLLCSKNSSYSFYVCVCVLRQGLCMSPFCPRVYYAGWPQAHRALPASASQVLKLKACITMPGLNLLFLNSII